jgi:elongation factor P
MGILQYNEVTLRKYITLDDNPYEVMASHVFRKQQRKPVNQTKLKNLITGKIVEHSFHQSDKVPEADLESLQVVFIYVKGDEYWFHYENDKSKRFFLSGDIVGSQIQYFKAGDVLEAIVYNEAIIAIKYPVKVDLRVTEAMPAVKGNTAQGASKYVKVESGATVSVPMFITEKDTIRINTETGEYTDRLGSNF